MQGKNLQEYILDSESESKRFAEKIAAKIKAGDVVAFYGNLGVGKSFFCREIIKFFCGDDIKVASPTFNLLQTYDAADFTIYHFDLYRLKHFEELYELGMEEVFDSHLCLIEWPEIAENILPAQTINIQLEILDENKRKIITNLKFP